MYNKLLSNTGTLVKFIFKRERINTIIWIFCIVALTLAVALAFPQLFESDNKREELGAVMQNPAMIAMVGPAFGDEYTNGAMMSQMMLLFTAIGVAVMNIFLVVKHTRRDEEDGRVELVRSLPVGRLSNLFATMIVVSIVNIAIALIIGLGLYACNIDEIDLHGSLLYGTVIGATGIFFASITALFSQLASTSRGAVAYSFILLGAAYLIRAGEASNEIAAYMSPLGLGTRTQAYVNNYWWPILVLLVLADVILLITAYLNLSRDLGEGIIAAKPGRRNAKKSLLSPFGLAVKNVRNIFIGWLITILLLGASYGSIFGDFGGFIEGNDMFRQMLGVEELTIEELVTMLGGDEELLTMLSANKELSVEELMEMLEENEHVQAALKERELAIMERFATLLMSIMAVLATAPACIILLKVRNEEKKGHNEHSLARGVSRAKLLSGYFVISIITAIIMVFSVVLGLWSAAYTVMDKPFEFGTLLLSGMVYIPAIYMMLGITLLLIAYLPRAVGIVWAYVGFSAFAIYLGALLRMPDWVAKISPFGHIPQIPVNDMNWSSVIIVSVIAIAFMVLGFMKYKKRDMIS